MHLAEICAFLIILLTCIQLQTNSTPLNLARLAEFCDPIPVSDFNAFFSPHICTATELAQTQLAASG